MTDKVYNADEVTLTIGGVLIDSGYADGEFIRIEQDSDDFGDVVGTDGEVAVSKTNDERADVHIFLMQTSDGNDVLSSLRALKSQPGVAGAAPLYIRDRQGRSIYEADACYVKKAPPVSFDRTATSREWVLRVPHLRRTDGGNAAI